MSHYVISRTMSLLPTYRCSVVAVLPGFSNSSRMGRIRETCTLPKSCSHSVLLVYVAAGIVGHAVLVGFA